MNSKLGGIAEGLKTSTSTLYVPERLTGFAVRGLEWRADGISTERGKHINVRENFGTRKFACGRFPSPPRKTKKASWTDRRPITVFCRLQKAFAGGHHAPT